MAEGPLGPRTDSSGIRGITPGAGSNSTRACALGSNQALTQDRHTHLLKMLCVKATLSPASQHPRLRPRALLSQTLSDLPPGTSNDKCDFEQLTLCHPEGPLPPAQSLGSILFWERKVRSTGSSLQGRPHSRLLPPSSHSDTQRWKDLENEDGYHQIPK